MLLLGNLFSAADFRLINSDSLLIKIRNHRFDEVHRLTQSFLSESKVSFADKQLLGELQYYNSINKEYGVYLSKPISKRKYSEPLNETIKALQLLNQGFYGLLYELNNDSESFKMLQESLKLAQKLENRPLCCEISKAILTYYIRLFNISDNDFQYYNDIYKDNLYDSTEADIQRLLEFFIKILNDQKRFSSQEVREIKKISESSIPRFYQLYAKKELAIYYELYENNYPKANLFYLEALSGEKKYGIDIFFNYTVLTCYSGLLVSWGKNREAIRYMGLIDGAYKGKTATNNLAFKYSTLSNAYAGLKIYDSAYVYKEKSRILKNEFEQSKHNAIVNQLNTIEKDKKINLQHKLLANYEGNKVVYFIIIGIALLIAFYYLVRWKKVERKKRTLTIEKEYLENEHAKTVEELKTVKRLVDKESIILKDKTKVNLEQLAFIKADDHYLSIHTIEKRNHFVRGKLNEIIEELPSNFIKCHRSYIINKNHIKQVQSKFIVMNDNSEIPISRGFKM